MNDKNYNSFPLPPELERLNLEVKAIEYFIGAVKVAVGAYAFVSIFFIIYFLVNLIWL